MNGLFSMITLVPYKRNFKEKSQTFRIIRSYASPQFELDLHAHDGHEVEVIFLRIDFKSVLKHIAPSAKIHFLTSELKKFNFETDLMGIYHRICYNCSTLFHNNGTVILLSYKIRPHNDSLDHGRYFCF